MIVQLDYFLTGLGKKQREEREKLKDGTKFKDLFQQMYILLLEAE